jgi:single-strand DNA-binding protein
LNLNKLLLAGNLTRDPEMRYTPKGSAICGFGLAVNRKWKTETGDEKEEVTFVDVTAFGKQAEVIAQYLKKGNPLFLEGRLKLDQWDDKQTGKRQQKLCVVLESCPFRPRGEKQQAAPKPKITAADIPELPPGVAEQFKDDVPF